MDAPLTRPLLFALPQRREWGLLKWQPLQPPGHGLAQQRCLLAPRQLNAELAGGPCDMQRAAQRPTHVVWQDTESSHARGSCPFPGTELQP